MVVQLCDIFSEIRKPYWPSSEDLRPFHNAFHIAGAYGLSNLVKVLRARDHETNPDLQDKKGRTPLSGLHSVAIRRLLKLCYVMAELIQTDKTS